jgi:hypothetical protein
MRKSLKKVVTMVLCFVGSKTCKVKIEIVIAAAVGTLLSTRVIN